VTEVVSQSIAAQFEAVLVAHLAEKLPSPVRGTISYLHSVADFTPAKCPAIIIQDGGSRTTFETARGRDAEGNLSAGYSCRTYTVTLGVIVKARDADNALHQLNLLRDAVRACFQDHYDLGASAFVASCTSDKVGARWDEASAVIQVAELQFLVEAYTLQGQAVPLE